MTKPHQFKPTTKIPRFTGPGFRWTNKCQKCGKPANDELHKLPEQQTIKRQKNKKKLKV